MAKDWVAPTNEGFDEQLCESSLHAINRAYGKMMEEVPNYQKSSIELMCANWISVKGKAKITELVTNLNNLVEGITTEMSGLFGYVNKQANWVAQDSDGIAYNPVQFTSSSERFSSANAKDDTENKKVAQWKEDETSNGIKQVKTFIETVTEQMQKISGNIDDIERAFGYSEQASAIQGRIAAVNQGVTGLIGAINKFLDPLEADYRAEASEHNSNIQAMSTESYESAPTANFEYVSGAE